MSRSKEEISEWLTRELAAQLKVEPTKIDPSVPFVQLGADSLVMVTLGGDLEVWLDRTLSPNLMWQYPSIDELAAFLSQTEEQAG